MIKNVPFYLLVFASGALVMVNEIIGARLLNPYFGSSTATWSSVLGVSLAALALGYYAGIKAISRADVSQSLCASVLIAASGIAVLSPAIQTTIFPLLLTLNLDLATVLGAVSVLFVPMTLLGSLTPMLTECFPAIERQPGMRTGVVLLVSTMGGLLGSLAIGLWAIPYCGLRESLSASVLISSLISLLAIQKRARSAATLACLIILYLTGRVWVQGSHPLQRESISGKVELRRLGSGQDEVVKLVVNRITQAGYHPTSNPKALAEYPYLLGMTQLVNLQPKQKALCLGLGGGTLPNLLCAQGCQVTAVEFDSFIITLARDHFRLNPRIRVIQDDARHFINLSKDHYDAVFVDLWWGESPPEHCFTVEAFTLLKARLNDTGLVVINLPGSRTGAAAEEIQCVLHTLQKAGFSTELYTTGLDVRSSNVLVLASKSTHHPIARDKGELIQLQVRSTRNDVHTDNRPVLAHLARKANHEVRKGHLGLPAR
ncbi:MAG TPA: fused MFS/spermidine synthase [Luteibaculaceae bacterium]|nr:fused MFS/spermidine synthase [Luteibaculaceae bacterium]